MLTDEIIEKMIQDAQDRKDDALADGNVGYYYWDGYIVALEAIQFKLSVDDSSVDYSDFVIGDGKVIEIEFNVWTLYLNLNLYSKKNQ